MRISQHNNTLIKMIVFIIGIVMLSAQSTGIWAFGTTGLKTNIDFSRINDDNTDSKNYSDYSFNDYLTFDRSNYEFGEGSNSAESLRLRHHQFISVNHNKWMQCKWIQCWYGGDLLTKAGGNPYCCALV